MKRSFRTAAALLFGLVVGVHAPVSADAREINVAVAANFTEPARAIAAAFSAKTGHDVVPSFGSTGQLYAQITQGAPFVVFLSADAERPEKLVAEGLGVKGSDRVYAYGRLVLWSADPALVTGPETLRAGKFAKIANTNPKTAPYGAAAVQVMTKLGVAEALAPRTVEGTNLTQTHAFISTGAAELGFLARSQMVGVSGGSSWDVPAEMHDPIAQKAVLLTRGESDPVAAAFLEFLHGPEAAKLISTYGYAPQD